MRPVNAGAPPGTDRNNSPVDSWDTLSTRHDPATTSHLLTHLFGLDPNTFNTLHE